MVMGGENKTQYGSIEEANRGLEIEYDEALQKSDVFSRQWEKNKLFLIFMGTILMGPANFILYKVAYSAYGEGGSFFVSNMVNLIYVGVGQIVLTYVELQGEITPAMREIPHSSYMMMAFFDACAGFLAAMGAQKTSGAVQQLLNQSLIPCTMLVSYLWLNRKSSWTQVIGAAVIFLGAGIVILPSFQQSTNNVLSSETRHSHVVVLMASLIYASSNIPTSLAYAYKEYGFKDLSCHVILLTQWVSVYQLIFGFLFMPLQMVPGLGSEHGMSMNESSKQMQMGWDCFLHRDEECQQKHAFWLLVAYIIVNFAFNTLGLYLVKHGSSVLNAISYAIILPLTVISFCLPIMGPYQESFNILTILGLVVVLCGFLVWRGQALQMEPARARNRSRDLTETETESDSATHLVAEEVLRQAKAKTKKGKAKAKVPNMFSPKVGVVGGGGPHHEKPPKVEAFQERVMVLAVAGALGDSGSDSSEEFDD